MRGTCAVANGGRLLAANYAPLAFAWNHFGFCFLRAAELRPRFVAWEWNNSATHPKRFPGEIICFLSQIALHLSLLILVLILRLICWNLPATSYACSFKKYAI